MSFQDDIARFTVKLDGIDKAMLPNVAAAVLSSIVEGSPVTGAPGQPVDTANLRTSYQLTFPTPETAQVSTNVAYAESNEDGIARPGGGPYIQRSPVGGRWSVTLTRVNFSRLVDWVVNAGIRPEGWMDNSAIGHPTRP